MVVLICDDTDLADGWGQIGEDDRYALEVQQKKALPMGINICSMRCQIPDATSRWAGTTSAIDY